MVTTRYESLCAVCDHEIPDDADRCPDHDTGGTYMRQSEAPLPYTPVALEGEPRGLGVEVPAPDEVWLVVRKVDGKVQRLAAVGGTYFDGEVIVRYVRAREGGR
jgi:hypothetical protein